MSVTVHGRANSINVQKVLWLLDEIGQPYERKDVGGAFGYPEGYEALNPMKLVPAVTVNGTAAFESNTILRLLARELGADSFYPQEPAMRARVEGWMDWQLAALTSPMRRIFQKTVRSKGEYTPADYDELVAAMRVVADNLTEGGNLLGADLTVADFAIAPYAHRWLELELADKPDLPALAAWRERLRARPAFVRHIDHPLT